MKTTALILSKKIGLMHKNQFFIMMSENISFQNLANHFFLVKEMNDGKWYCMIVRKGIAQFYLLQLKL